MKFTHVMLYPDTLSSSRMRVKSRATDSFLIKLSCSQTYTKGKIIQAFLVSFDSDCHKQEKKKIACIEKIKNMTFNTRRRQMFMQKRALVQHNDRWQHSGLPPDANF